MSNTFYDNQFQLSQERNWMEVLKNTKIIGFRIKRGKEKGYLQKIILKKLI